MKSSYLIIFDITPPLWKANILENAVCWLFGSIYSEKIQQAQQWLPLRENYLGGEHFSSDTKGAMKHPQVVEYLNLQDFYFFRSTNKDNMELKGKAS